MPEPTDLLTSKELAARWGCSAGTLANQRSAGTGVKFVKFANRVRYRLSDVLEYEANRIVDPEQDN